MDKRVLVTGGTGFIGSAVVEQLLAKGYEVHLLTHTTRAPQRPGLFQYPLDLLDTPAVKSFFVTHSFENLMHFAWYSGKGCHGADLNLDWTVATLNLLKFFKESGGKCFLGSGSISEYEFKYGYFTEDITPTDSNIMYGNCKNSVYRIAKVFCKKNQISFKWPRNFNLYGPNEKPQRLMPSVILSCLKGEDVKVSDCVKFQDYLHVEDIARGIVTVFESEVTGAVNICSGKPVQLRAIVEKIAELTHFKGRILWGAVPAAFGDEVVVGNNAKLLSLGWQPKYTLEEGLQQTINWWKEHNNASI